MLLIERTEGNPFFLEESVRTLVEAQVLAGKSWTYRLAQALPTVQVPPTVQAVLAARIDRLTQDAKRILQTAAVIGNDVPLPLLQTIAELSDEALYRSLAHLQAADFLYETSLFPERVYTFKHALTHEGAYGSLLQERRRVLHAQIVEALEALSRDRVIEQVERLAYHALRGEVWEKALTYGRQAGDKTLARSAYREAVAYFDQALRALSYLPETRDTCEQAIDLRIALRAALQPSGDWRRVLEVLHEAESLAAALDDSRRLGRVLLFLSVHCRHRGTYDQAISSDERALALATASGDVIVQALANQYLGMAYQALGSYHRAVHSFGQTVAALDSTRRHDRFGSVFLPAVQPHSMLATCHAELGTFAEGIALGEEGLRIAEAVGHPLSLMTAWWALGLLALRQGDLPRALPRLDQAMRLCREVDLPLYFP